MDRDLELANGVRLLVRGIGEDETVRNVDIELIEPHGPRWSATVLTLDEIARLMTTYRESGECLFGSYFRVPDLLIIDQPTLESLVEVISGLLRDGSHAFELSRLLDET